MKTITISHAFVESIPKPMQPRMVYISIRFAMVGHLCCCGCGEEVMTPLNPVRWRLEYDGRSVSLRPSIGNWSLPCRSHYWIINNSIQWAEDWSEAKIARAIKADRRTLDEHIEYEMVERSPDQTPAPGWFAKLRSWLVRNR
ncbi:hypothetical protein ABH935_008580 [Catenulispora sp. GAS73]|uniref:DUF6527 family protein n=1 Tax=Catenulispora sp. GAS73 TaxID=3156269 RepID=UPI0035138A67